MKVCEKVRKKGTTSYNEVADELVGEFTNSLNNSVTDQVSTLTRPHKFTKQNLFVAIRSKEY